MGALVCAVSLRISTAQLKYAKGDKEKITQAREGIRWSFVGLVAICVTYFVLSIILNFFGVEPLPFLWD
jgi:hypothetical protein